MHLKKKDLDFLATNQFLRGAKMLRKFPFTSTFATASCKMILVLTLNSIKKTQCEDNAAIAIRIPLTCSVENPLTCSVENVINIRTHLNTIF